MTTTQKIEGAGQVVVRLAQDLRLVGVSVPDTAEMRRVDDLASAFDRAYADAINETVPAARRSYAGEQLTSKPVLRSMPPMPQPDPHRLADLRRINELAAQAEDSSVVAAGVSDNQCVHVRLDAASSRGRLVDVDPGWLSNATPANIAKAISEAFNDAYEKRGNR